MVNSLLIAFLMFSFFILPILIVLFFAISLFQFCHGKIKMKRGLDGISEEKLVNRKIRLIVACALMGMLIILATAVVLLLVGAVSFM